MGFVGFVGFIGSIGLIGLIGLRVVQLDPLPWGLGCGIQCAGR